MELKGPAFRLRESPDLQVPSPRYYGTHSQEVVRAGLGYGTRLSGYTAPDLPGE